MKKDKALALAEERAWEQTKALLGPLPPIGETYAWFAKRDEFFSEIMRELKSLGVIESDEEF